jgi:hypothetical protein
MRKIQAAACGVLLLLLLVPVLAAADRGAATNKGPARTHSFHIAGQLTFIDATSGFPMVVADKGVATRLGLFVGVGKYASPGAGFGIYFLATGEQLYWRQGVGAEIEFTGGTGRFANATGKFTFAMSGGEYGPGPNGTVSYVAHYTGEGTITY